MLHKKKERPTKYEKPLEVDMDFDEFMQRLVRVPPPPKGKALEGEEPEKGKPVLVRKEGNRGTKAKK